MEQGQKDFYEARYGDIVRAHATVKEETIRVFEVDLPALRKALKVGDGDRNARHAVRKIAKIIARAALAADATLTKMRIEDADAQPGDDEA